MVSRAGLVGGPNETHTDGRFILRRGVASRNGAKRFSFLLLLRMIHILRRPHFG